ncbi:MAG: cysteine desulfurase family protein, partial [Candidatus Bathyarchaeia archaeon]
MQPPRKVCMDYQAGMPVAPEVIETLKPYLTEYFGNPGVLHGMGREPKLAIDDARAKIAALINAERKEEILFTSGGTESNNLAIKGIAFRNKEKGTHVITSSIEHMSILNPVKYLTKFGFKASFLPVDPMGIVNLEALQKEITNETILVSIMLANGEIGTIQPIKKISDIIKANATGGRRIYLHVDATAACGQLPIDVREINADLMTLSSNDMYGPRGVGALYVKTGTRLEPVIHGGGQERGLRSGTENIAGVVGMAKAAELTKQRVLGDKEYLTHLRDKLIDNILEQVPESHLNGHRTQRLPNNVNIRFTAVEGEGMILNLDDRGIYAATGSACATKTLEPSYVLAAIGLDEVARHGTLLLTVSRYTTEEDVDYVLENVPSIIERLRSISPLWKKQEWQQMYTAGMKWQEQLSAE